jgi:putative endopeptidase
MEELVKNLAASLKDRIQGLSWMSEETKAKAIAKWETFTPKIGYPDKWRDWSGLQTQRDSYLGNVRAANEFNYKFNLSKIGKPVDKTEWGMTPQTVNAYYNPLQNEIVFPAAILQPPFFDPKADDALNYGGIGAVIGHEMTHGYDDQGARFGPTGNMEDWWTPADKKNFEGLTGKLVKQFDQYKVDGQAVNGHLTLGENIADLGGLATAYDALQKAPPARKMRRSTASPATSASSSTGPPCGAPSTPRKTPRSAWPPTRTPRRSSAPWVRRRTCRPSLPRSSARPVRRWPAPASSRW